MHRALVSAPSFMARRPTRRSSSRLKLGFPLSQHGMTDSPFLARRAARRLVACAAVAAALACTFALPAARAADPMTDDPFLWLEDVSGTRALDWARARNAETARALETRPDYPAAYARLLSIYDSRDRIPYVRRRGDRVYNVWQDENNKRGLIRRATLADFRKAEVPW